MPADHFQIDEQGVTSQVHDKKHMAQVNLEANTTEEFGDRVDKFPRLHPMVQTTAATQKNSIVSVLPPTAK